MTICQRRTIYFQIPDDLKNRILVIILTLGNSNISSWFALKPIVTLFSASMIEFPEAMFSFTSNYPLVNKHRPCQIGVGRLVSIKNWGFSGSMFIYQRVPATNQLYPVVSFPSLEPWPSCWVRPTRSETPAISRDKCSKFWLTSWECLRDVSGSVRYLCTYRIHNINIYICIVHVYIYVYVYMCICIYIYIRIYIYIYMYT